MAEGAPPARANGADGRPIVFFLCTANACRSQMAEALCAAKWPQLRALSAGVRPGAEVDPLAVAVLAEVGIDASVARNKSIKEAAAATGGVQVALVVRCRELAMVGA
jgi:protein-tyrosine-phosphatase